MISMIVQNKPCDTLMKKKCYAIHNFQLSKVVKQCRQLCGMVNFLTKDIFRLLESLQLFSFYLIKTGKEMLVSDVLFQLYIGKTKYTRRNSSRFPTTLAS